MRVTADEAENYVLLTGATGLVGQRLVNLLLHDNRYSEVTCLVRRPLSASAFHDPHNKLRPVVIDFEMLQDYQGYFSVNHVYCCLGTTLKAAGFLTFEEGDHASKLPRWLVAPAAWAVLALVPCVCQG